MMKYLFIIATVLVLSLLPGTAQSQNCGTLEDTGTAYLTEREQGARVRILANMLCPETVGRQRKSRDRKKLQEVITAAITESLDIKEFNPYQAEELGALAVSLYFSYDRLAWMDEGERRDVISLISDFMQVRTDKFMDWQDRLDFGPTQENLAKERFGKDPDIAALVAHSNAYIEQFRARAK